MWQDRSREVRRLLVDAHLLRAEANALPKIPETVGERNRLRKRAEHLESLARRMTYIPSPPPIVRKRLG